MVYALILEHRQTVYMVNISLSRVTLVIRMTVRAYSLAHERPYGVVFFPNGLDQF